MSQLPVYRIHRSVLNRLKRNARRWFPQGSPLWFPYFFLRRLILRKPLYKIAWYRIHGNILLEPYKAIYFDIPKVACSSLKRVWSDVLGLPISAGDAVETIHRSHFPYANRYRISHRYADYFKFCFVRNPWDRLVSCYMDKIKDAQGGIYSDHYNYFLRYLESRGICAQRLAFEEFVEIVCEIPDDEAESHFRSQHCFIQDHRENLLVDFVGRFENLSEDFETVAKRLGIRASLPHLRSTTRRRFQDYYNAYSRDKVFTRYRRDIDLFGYAFTGHD